MKELYSTLTTFLGSGACARSCILYWSEYLETERQKNRVGEALGEFYHKLSQRDSEDKSSVISEKSDNKVNLGSIWLLECTNKHQFHYHTFEENNDYLSFRRILFYSETGFTVEIFPSSGRGCLEKYIISGAGIAELVFDGKYVHRFRPVGEGRLFALSIHSQDLSTDNDVAKTQTHLYKGDRPEEKVIRHLDFG